jgi:2-polyprenyl-6-methoxyphenol hydroxylase-like FAD-dependent oxidoreductase
VIVVGGGVGGLGSALALARAGHRVTLLERDPLPELSGADEAFRATRRGAPQSHQTHGFPARLQVLLRDRFPDVLADLLAVGCTTMSTTADLGEPRPGDDDLAVLIVRRTTLDWVLRRAVLAQPGADVRTGAGVAELMARMAEVMAHPEDHPLPPRQGRPARRCSTPSPHPRRRSMADGDVRTRTVLGHVCRKRS